MREAIVFACLRGLAKSFPKHQATIAELIALAHREYRKTGLSSYEKIEAHLQASLDETAAQSFHHLSIPLHQKFSGLLEELKLLQGQERQEFGRQTIATIGHYFRNSVPFRAFAACCARPAQDKSRAVGQRFSQGIQEARNLLGGQSQSDGIQYSQSLMVKVIEGPHSGLEFTFQDRSLIFIGRSGHPGDRAQITLPKDPKISRNHCLIEFNPPECIVRDLSLNGVRIGQQRLQDFAVLKKGAQLALGNTVLSVDYDLLEKEEAIQLECLECRQLFYHGSADETVEFDRPVCANCLAANNFSSQPFPGMEVLSVLGQGAHGKVYLGQHISSNELVAIKTMRPELAIDPRKIANFLNKAKSTANFSHPNSIRLFDGGFAAGVFYLLVEYLNGTDAGTYLKKPRQPFTWSEAFHIIKQIGSAVEAAHKQGMIHREIKAGNILLGPKSQGAYLAKLSDFGLLKSFEDSGLSYLSRSGQKQKIPSYMAPEQIRNVHRSGVAADIYSLGASLQFLITGQDPYDFSNKHFSVVILEHEAISLHSLIPNVPAGLQDIVTRCLKKNPAQRFPSVTEFLAALDKIAPPL